MHAVRIDEGAMTLYALTDKGEARVSLHANCRTDQYLHRVKEFLGGHALGSPGGYPVYLQRWTRMGQTSDKHLDALLLLGEPEAVVAVAHAPGLTDELARRAWWCQPTMEMARWMLEKDAVIEGRMGKVLADFLIEHLPFEENPDARMHTIRLVLYGKLTDAATTAKLWRMAQRRALLLHRLSRIHAGEPAQGSAGAGRFCSRPRRTLGPLAEAGNPYAQRLLALLSANGQTWLKAVTEVLARPSTSLVAYALLDAISRYFHPMGYPLQATTLEEVFPEAEAMAKGEIERPESLKLLCETAPEYAPLDSGHAGPVRLEQRTRRPLAVAQHRGRRPDAA